ncbi:MAG TPA: 3-hexulose-6-phosphate synthase [Candidatus Tripitaka californicus]|uniref:3-hexulose-6-phosphate synthase n=2 Tax=Candidatus Tripitaka californicus TaxID=3367616 RepID=UPI004027982A|nr:orotidine 5'-phosphate decarboxylase [Planctomycetota bacterium]
MLPILQVALDFVDLHRAMKVAEEAVEGGADWLEAGTPLIKSEGLNAVRRLHEAFPALSIVADMKTMDAGRIEMESAAKAGAKSAIVMGTASDSTIKECIAAGRNYGLDIGVDLLGVKDYVTRAREVEGWGASYLGVHVPIDDQMKGMNPFGRLREVASQVTIPVAVAGGINSENAPEAVKAGARIIIVGGAITKSADAKKATREIKKTLRTGQAISTELYRRVSGNGIKEALQKVSTSNVSDGDHRAAGLCGLQVITPGQKMVGSALTVRCYPGDWAKPVEAIDVAHPGQVLVIDAGGVGPAIWGELATLSAIQKGLAGVVVNGAIRDVHEIRKLNFPAFTRLVMPNAGEPKGLGEIGVPVNISGITVCTGDWIIGDDDGVMVIPRQEAEEMVNRAMDWLEKENRIRAEIQKGKKSLAKAIDLLKWEKK